LIIHEQINCHPPTMMSHKEFVYACELTFVCHYFVTAACLDGDFFVPRLVLCSSTVLVYYGTVFLHYIIVVYVYL
jgi:hypothetical protein